MKFKFPYTFLMCILVVFLFIYNYTQKNNQNTATFTGPFDTVTTITTYNSTDNTEAYKSLINNFDNLFSVFNKDSEIYKLNEQKHTIISDETEELLQSAIVYSTIFKKYFDITVNPYCVLWEKAKETNTLPQITPEIKKSIGVENLMLDIENNTATLINANSSITLGAIAKGYTTDRLVDNMKLSGETSALINLGGNIYVLGDKPNGKKWSIAIQDPKNSSEHAAVLNVSDSAVITSGGYERYYEINGVKYHHLLDPSTGYPSSSGLLSATAIGKDAMLCDVLSTVMFNAGTQKALEIANQYNIDAVLIEDKNIYCTKNIEENLSISDDYTLISK